MTQLVTKPKDKGIEKGRSTAMTTAAFIEFNTSDEGRKFIEEANGTHVQQIGPGKLTVCYTSCFLEECVSVSFGNMFASYASLESACLLRILWAYSSYEASGSYVSM